jgi:SpoVK/Ycf46/Vps4 family AAA+-type ATPase
LPAAVSHSVNGKAWVNQILESNPVPTLWVTNRIEQIDPAFRRRFAYHLELKSPPPGAREQLVRRALDGVAVSDAFVAKLTERKGLTPAQIRTAVRFAELAHGEDTRRRRSLRGADRAPDEELRRRPGPPGQRPGAPGPAPGHHLRPGHAATSKAASRSRASSRP